MRGGQAYIFLLTYFNILPIMNEYMKKTSKRKSKDVPFSESWRKVRGSSVSPELALEFFC